MKPEKWVIAVVGPVLSGDHGDFAKAFCFKSSEDWLSSDRPLTFSVNNSSEIWKGVNKPSGGEVVICRGEFKFISGQWRCYGEVFPYNQDVRKDPVFGLSDEEEDRIRQNYLDMKKTG